MRPLSMRDLLDLWDAGSGRDHTSRALLLLDYCGLAPGGVDPVNLPIGARDGLLMELREQLFGRLIDAVDQCPACGARHDLRFDLRDLLAGHGEATSEPVRIEIDGHEMGHRLPTSRDLLAIRECADVADASKRLLKLTQIDVNGDVPMAAMEVLSESVQNEIAAAFGVLDPLADVRLELACEECGCAWTAHFDIVSYLWTEIERACQQTLWDVHLLARAYGWTEDIVLRLSSRRRRQYLEMLANG